MSEVPLYSLHGRNDGCAGSFTLSPVPSALPQRAARTPATPPPAAPAAPQTESDPLWRVVHLGRSTLSSGSLSQTSFYNPAPAEPARTCPIQGYLAHKKLPPPLGP